LDDGNPRRRRIAIVPVSGQVKALLSFRRAGQGLGDASHIFRGDGGSSPTRYAHSEVPGEYVCMDILPQIVQAIAMRYGCAFPFAEKSRNS
jgi:hypothetical protein